ncbi:MAG: hypothetical protein Q8N61_00245, partial [bacterium]|nr:hypothetical protein [bacterium]
MKEILLKNKNKNLEYIPLSEAGHILNTSRDYMNVLVRRGKFKAVKLGRNWFTTAQWIEDYRKKSVRSTDNYIPLSEAGHILNTSRDYMNVLVRRGKLHAIKLGRNWVTTREWISEYKKVAGRQDLKQQKDLSAETLAKAEKAEFASLREISRRRDRDAGQFFTEREKQLQTEALLPEIKLPSRELKFEEKSKILESAFAKVATDKVVEERFKSVDVSEFQKISRQLGILKSLKSWSHFKLSLASGLTALVLVVSLGVVSGLISLPNFNSLKYQASIFSDIFSAKGGPAFGWNNFSSDLPFFSQWLDSGLDKFISFLKFKSPSELAIENLKSGKSKLLKSEETPYSINTLAEAEALDSGEALAPALAEATAGKQEGKVTGGEISISGSEFKLLENRLSIVEADLKDQTNLINSELSLQKKTILGILETLFGIAKLVPSYPISTIVVQGQPATLTTYSIAPQVNTGFDRLSADYFTLAHDAVINGSLTVKSGANLNSLSVSGNTSLTGNTTIGGTLAVTGDTTLSNLTINGILTAPNTSFTSASTTNLTISGNAWINKLAVTGTATTTFNGPITSASGNFIIAGDSASNILLNPYGGNIGIGTTSPGSLLSIHSSGNVYFGGNLTVSGNSLFQNATTTGLTVQGGTLLGSLSAGAATTTSLSVTGGSSFAAATFSQNVGIGTTTPTQALTIQGNQFIYGGLGVGLATTTNGALQTSGDVFVGRNLYVSGTSNIGAISLTNASTTYLTVSDTAWINKLNVSGLTTLANVSAANATTTGLTVSGGTSLGSL